MLWFLILMGILYTAVNVGLLLLIFNFMTAIGGFFKKPVAKIIFAILYAVAAFSVFYWLFFENPTAVYYLKSASNIWIGIFIYLILWCASAEIVTLVLRLFKLIPKGPGKRTFTVVKGCIVCALVIAFSVYGTAHAKKIYITEYDVHVDNKHVETDSLDIVLVADNHIGYSVGYPLMQQMVDKINAQHPDLVLFGGDIIDNDFEGIKDIALIQDAFQSIQSTYGVYGVYGNHDIEEKLLAGFHLPYEGESLVSKDFETFLEESNIHILEDEVVEVLPGITLIGRVDESCPNIMDENLNRKSIEELTKDIDPENFIIDLDHEPSELEEKAVVGIDMDLGGHTHKGQIFPGTLTIHAFWDNAYGLKTINGMTSVVTSGVGFWGPAMRVGSNSEIAVIHVTFN